MKWDKVKIFFREMVTELKRMDWPSRESVWTSTWIVIVLSIIFAIIIGLMDNLFAFLMRGILR